jgi:hypothetical protein
MQTINNNIERFEKDIQNCRDNNKLTEHEETKFFSLLNAYFKLIGSISLKNMKENARNTMKTFLIKIIELELLFNGTNLTCSFSGKLLQFINKLSNSQVIEYIKEIIDTKRDEVFAVLYEFIKHPNSSSLRERLCREDVLISKSSVMLDDLSPEALKWNLILKQVCRYCPYYMLGNNHFYQFFEAQSNMRRVEVRVSNILVEEYKEVQMKITSHFLCVNKHEIEVKNSYMKYFLDERCYNFRHRMVPYLNAISDPTDVDYFFRLLNKMIVNKLSRNAKPSTEQSELHFIENIRFLISKVTVCVIDRMKEENLKDLVDFLSNISIPTPRVMDDEDWANVLQLVFIVLVRYKLEITDQHKNFLTSYLKICWGNISDSNQTNTALLNFSKIIIAFMNAKYRIFKVLNQPDRASQFYQFLITQSFDESQDEDSMNVWLECIKCLIPICLSDDNKDHQQDMQSLMNLYDSSKRGAQTGSASSSQNRFLKALILSKDFFRGQFVDIMDKRFFNDISIVNHSVFDILLILLVFSVKRGSAEAAKAVLFAPGRKTVILERLISILKNEQDSARNFIDKFYNMVLMFLKFLDFHRVDVSLTKPMTDDLLKTLKIDDIRQEPSILATRTLRSQTYFMTLTLFILRRSGESERHEFCPRILSYLGANKIIQNYNVFIYCPQLFQVLFNLLKVCVRYCANFDSLLKTANQSIRESIDKKEYYGLYFSLFVYHFAMERLEQSRELRVANFESLLSNFLGILQRKKSKAKNPSLSFEEIFEMSEDSKPKDHSTQSYYKFFVLTMLRLLVLSFKTTRTDADFANFVRTVEVIMNKLPYFDYDLKFQTFLLIKAILHPDMSPPESRVFGIDDLSFDQQLRLLNATFLDNNFRMKESTNPHFRRMFDEYYTIVHLFIKRYPLSEALPDLWSTVINPNFLLFEKPLKREFVFEVESLVGNNLFERLLMFFKCNDSAMKTLKAGPTESYEAFTSILVYHLRAVEFKEQEFKVRLRLNGKTFECHKELLSAFIAVQEIEGFENTFSVKFMKEVLGCQFGRLSQEQKEEFVVNFIEFVVSQRSTAPHEYSVYLELLFALCPDLSSSEVLANLGLKKGKVLRLLNHYESWESPALARKNKAKRPSPKVDSFRQMVGHFYKHLSGLTRRTVRRLGCD